jgi:hypothetical protein
MPDLKPSPPVCPEVCTMAQLQDETSRTDLLNRLKRAEGQLRASSA